MEKKIEIDQPEEMSLSIGSMNYKYLVFVDERLVFRAYGHTPEEAQQNARIAASGYLVEELVEYLTEHRNELAIIYKPNHPRMINLDKLLTKAKTV